LSGSVGAVSFHPFSRSTTAPTQICAVAHVSFTIRVGSWDEVVTISCLKAYTAADAMSGSLRRCGRPPNLRPGGPAATKWVSRPSGPAATKRASFSDPLVSSPSSSTAPPQNGPGTVFLPVRRFLHARDGRHLHISTEAVPVPSTGTAPRGYTSDLFSSQPRPELRGSPVESCLHPW
jgi:hypothetical protein